MLYFALDGFSFIITCLEQYAVVLDSQDTNILDFKKRNCFLEGSLDQNTLAITACLLIQTED